MPALVTREQVLNESHPMPGQANTAPTTADDVAALLLDTPDQAENEEEQAAGATPPEDQDTDEAPDDDESPDESDEESDEEPEEPTSSRKFKVTVKGEDGADLEQEVDEKELIAGYQRHSDYTRKTQALAQREEQAAEVVRTKVQEAQNHYIQQAQMAHAIVARLAGLKSPEEMLALSQSDPAGYVAEQARTQQIQGAIANLQNKWQQEQSVAQQQRQQEMQKAFSRCWGVLGQQGIDKPKLQHIFDVVSKDYGIDQSRFANLADPTVVMVMRDAVAYRELQKKKTEVTRKAEAAPRLPQKQNVPRNETADKRRIERLRSGKGSRDDLAAFIARNNL